MNARVVRARAVSALHRTGLLDFGLRLRDIGRNARSFARAAIWRRRLAEALTHEQRLVITRHRAGVWVCDRRTSLLPTQVFVEAFEQCLPLADGIERSDTTVVERDGGEYPALEMTTQTWTDLVRAWHAGSAPWHLHVQPASLRSRPECVRAASRRTVDSISQWTGRVVVFVAVAHPSSPIPPGRRLGVDVNICQELEESPNRQPWGDSSLEDWVRDLRRPPFPIDAVYTWVDDGDPEWRQRRAATANEVGSDTLMNDSVGAHRYTNRDELRFSLRSIALYAEWFDRVHVVSDRQRPPWANSTLDIVDHMQILPEAALPTFNSHAIETGLHRTPGLQEHYVYLNDDVFFDGPTAWSKFFTHDGHARFFPSKALIPDTGAETTTIDHATTNGRALVERQFGSVVSQKMKHTPHAQLRSVHSWMESAFEEEQRSTSHSQFRSVDDQSFASFLHHYVGLELDATEVGHDLRYDYFNAAGPALDTRFAGLRDRPGYFLTYCINDGDVDPNERDRVSRAIRAHLELSLSFPSLWESSGSDGS